jgi:hypothetical protein
MISRLFSNLIKTTFLLCAIAFLGLFVSAKFFGYEPSVRFLIVLAILFVSTGAIAFVLFKEGKHGDPTSRPSIAFRVAVGASAFVVLVPLGLIAVTFW